VKVMAKKKRNNKKPVALTIVLCVLIIVLVILVSVNLKGDGTVGTVSETAVSSNLNGIKMVLDAGHGGADPGTIGVSTGGKESDVNLAITKRLEQALIKQGVAVVMTREDENSIADTKAADMTERKRIITESGEDLTISIHQNKFEDTGVAGPQVFFYPGSVEGEKFAKCLQQALNDTLKPAKPRSALSADYYVLRYGSEPAVIIECGFMSNPEEDVLLHKTQYQIMIVNAIVEGVGDYVAESSAELKTAES